MRKLFILGIIVLIITAIAGCKTLTPSEQRAQIKASEHAMSSK